MRTLLDESVNPRLLNRAREVADKLSGDGEYDPKEDLEREKNGNPRGRPAGKKNTPSGIEKVLNSMANSFLPDNKPFLKAF